MPDVSYTFDISNSSNISFASGSLVINSETGVVRGISGTAFGANITSLSTFRGADNILYKEYADGPARSPRNHWSATLKGLSFSAGNTEYNLSGTGTGFARSGQIGDTLYVSDGSTYTTNFNSDAGIQPICFTTGTLIRTARGEVAVEDLRVGDEAVIASGARRPIVWIGHRDLDGAGKALPHHQQPVRIRAGAFGPGLPARDLRLSPGHPVLVGANADGESGHLVPIMCLINGTTITREPATTVTYWHVELDAHDILLAEGLPAESYLDWGDRPFFDEGSDHALHNPDFVVPALNARCRPVTVEGPVVEAERTRLSSVFAAVLGKACAWDEAGRFDWVAA